MSVKGLKELNEKLKRIPASAQVAARTAVTLGATELATLQKNLVPVDKGDLRDSIVVTPPGGTTPPYSQPGGSRTAGPVEAIVTAGNTDVRYAHLVEFGSAPHTNAGSAAGSRNPGARAQPYFWPSYRALRTRIRSRITRNINTAIKSEATK